MTVQNQEKTMVQTGPLDDLIADLDAKQLKSLVVHLFLTTKNPAFRANVKAWRKGQKNL